MALYQSQIEELEGHLSTMAIHEGVAPQSKCIIYHHTVYLNVIMLYA